MVTPTSAALVPIEEHEGCYKFDVEEIQKAKTMDWTQFFELGRQAATTEWQPANGVQQVPHALPGPELMPPNTWDELEQWGGFSLKPSSRREVLGNALIAHTP